VSRVVIPPLMRDLTGGLATVVVGGGTVGEALADLDCRFPGCAARLCPGGAIAAGYAVAVDGVVAPQGLRAVIGPDSEIRLIPALAGG